MSALVQTVLRSPGDVLDPATRASMESHFAHDFSMVRIHSDARAAESARAVRARAYAVGPHVVFGTGQYAPSSNDGRRLLAHELTHVVQQPGASIGSSGSLRVGTKNDPEEAHADEMAERVANFAASQFRPGTHSYVRIRKGRRDRHDRDGSSEASDSPTGGRASMGSVAIIRRAEGILPPAPIEEDPAARLVADETPGETHPAINGITINTGSDLERALPQPQYQARPAARGGYECRGASAIDVYSGTDMTVTTPPGPEGWRAEASPAWLAANGEMLCLVQRRSVPVLLRHERNNRAFYDTVRRSETEHHGVVAKLHRTILKPYHDRIAAAARTVQTGRSGEECAESVARTIDRAGTMQRFYQEWSNDQARRDGPGGTHVTNANLESTDLCTEATITLLG